MATGGDSTLHTEDQGSRGTAVRDGSVQSSVSPQRDSVAAPGLTTVAAPARPSQIGLAIVQSRTIPPIHNAIDQLDRGDDIPAVHIVEGDG